MKNRAFVFLANMIKFFLSLQVLSSVKLLPDTKSVFSNFQDPKCHFGHGLFQIMDGKRCTKELKYKANPIKLDNQLNDFQYDPNKLNNVLKSISINIDLKKERIDNTSISKLERRVNSIELDKQSKLKANNSIRLNNRFNYRNKLNNDLIFLFIRKQNNSIRRKSFRRKGTKYHNMGTCDRRLLKTCKTACKKTYQNVCSYYKCPDEMKKKFFSKCSSKCKKIYKKAFGGYAK